MKQSRRRFLCRAGFVLFCLVPTLMVAAWIAWPAQTAEWEEKLSHLLGLDVTMRDVSYPRPNVTVLHDVRLTDPEIGNVAHARAVTISRNSKVVTLDAEQPWLAHRHLQRAVELLHDRILRGRPVDASSVSLRTKALALETQANGSVDSLTDAVCTIENTENGCRLTLGFRLDSMPVDRRCEFAVERRRPPGAAPTTRWHVNTGETYLPCGLVAEQVRGLGRLGAACEFRGVLWGELTPQGWEADVNGHFRNVDLDRLVGQQFPHTLTGQADVELTRAKFREGRLIDAGGVITCRGGTIGVELIEAAVEQLKLKQTRPVILSPIDFTCLDLGFRIDNTLLIVRGHCDARGTILEGLRGEPLLSDATASAVPAISLARLLVPHDDLQVPLTQETAALLRILPAPHAISRKTTLAP